MATPQPVASAPSKSASSRANGGAAAGAAGGGSKAAGPAAATPTHLRGASVYNSVPGSNLPASAGVASRALTTVSSPLPAGEATAAVSTRERELSRLCVLVQQQMRTLVVCGFVVHSVAVAVTFVMNPKIWVWSCAQTRPLYGMRLPRVLLLCCFGHVVCVPVVFVGIPAALLLLLPPPP